MAFKSGYRLWDDEYEREHWTADELEESNARVARIGAVIDAEHKGEISHDEAMIRHLMLDPDLADIMLEDAINDGDIHEIRKVQERIQKARERTRNNPPSLTYWQEVADNAQETARTGYEIKEVIAQLKKALVVLNASVATA
ncbi:MAG: hypothetical protein IJS39_11020 [Synergistaceae bacterium]|nr:hypothetical protein [Synergistaceae bacterium]